MTEGAPDPRPQRPRRRAYTAWELARARPGADLIVIGDSGHTGSASMTDEADAAADRLYRRITQPA